MAPSLTLRPRTRDERPPTRDNTDHSLIIPSRTSSLHSRITQPLPSTLNVKQGARSPKTLTHAYMVCGVGREPSQWVKAPAPAQGKIGHMKGAVGTFWLPEILGSSPRLEQDNEIARSLHAAMRVCVLHDINAVCDSNYAIRPAFLTTSKFALEGANPIAFTTLLSSSKIPLTLSTVLPCVFGLAPTRREPKRSATCVGASNQTSSTALMRPTGSRTA
jgi:hypothetical protein